MLFIEYPKCTTCKKAKKFLIDNNISFQERDIKNDNPTEEEIKMYLTKTKKDINKLFNTSGIKYRELDLKSRLPNMTENEKIKLLASDGMLIKRPILVSKNETFFGFKEEEWKKILK